MKSIELLPTKENILKTLLKDSLGRNQEIKVFLELLTKIEGHFVISIDGQWGTGKTFFVKQCGMVLDAINNKDILTKEEKTKIKSLPIFSSASLDKLKQQNYVYFDAWENDNFKNPILAILNTLIGSRSGLVPASKGQLKQLITEMGKQCFNKATGISVDPLLDILKSPSHEEAKEQQGLHDYIEKIIDQFTSKGKRLVIFIDELDRCNPSFAVKLLEQIKHYFLLDNVTFVFSTNIFELSKTINRFYGNSFRGDKYLSRFFDLSLPMPQIDQERYYKYMVANDSQFVFEQNKILVMKYFHMTLRDINKYIITNSIIEYKNIEKNIHVLNNKGFFLDIEWSLIPFLIGLKITNMMDFRPFINGRKENMLNDYLSQNDTFWALLNRDESRERILNLCNIENEKNINEKEFRSNITTKIYSYLFVHPIDKTKLSDMSDSFWYYTREQINDILMTISQIDLKRV